MTLPATLIIEAIDQAPLNRGRIGADWLAYQGNVPVTFDNGDIALFDNHDDGIFEMHLLFQSRGREAIKHTREALAIMFTDYRASLVMALVPDFRRDVKMIARWAGGKSAGIRPTSEGPCELFVMSKIQWKVANQ